MSGASDTRLSGLELIVIGGVCTCAPCSYTAAADVVCVQRGSNLFLNDGMKNERRRSAFFANLFVDDCFSLIEFSSIERNFLMFYKRISR